MVGTKWWGAFLWLDVLLNVASFIMNLIVGHWIWVVIAIFVLVVLMPLLFKQHYLEREARRRAVEEMAEGADV